MLRTGVTWNIPYETSESFYDDDTSDTDDDEVDHPEWEVSLSNDYQGAVSAGYFWADEFSVELWMAMPFEHTFYAEADLADALVGAGRSTNLGGVDTQPIALFVQFYPPPFNETIQAYGGIGLGYTQTSNASVNGVFNPVLETVFGDGTHVVDVESSDSVGLFIGIGVDFYIHPNVGLFMSGYWMDMNTDVEFTLSNGRALDAELQVDPWLLSGGLAVRF